MIQPASNARQFQRPEIRAEFERARRELNGAILEPSPAKGAARLLELAATLDAGVSRCKPELFGNSLCWTDENQAMVAWICRQHRGIAGLGRALPRRSPTTPRPMSSCARASRR